MNGHLRFSQLEWTVLGQQGIQQGIQQAESLSGLPGREAWRQLSELNPRLQFGYSLICPDDGEARLSEFRKVPNEGGGHFMLLTEIVPMVVGPFGWFGLPEATCWNFDFQPIFVHESWLFFEFLDLTWEGLLVELAMGQSADLPNHSVRLVSPIKARDAES